VVAGQVGRWTLATSSARGLMAGAVEGGASTQWKGSGAWTLRLGFRLTQGRQSADDPWLSGMPDLSRSAALRLSAGRELSSRWSLALGWQQDLLHQQGGRASLGLGWRQPLDDGWALNASVGTIWANAQAMRAFYGVTAEQARANRPVWSPGGGWEQWQWGLGATKALGPHWRLSVQWGRSRLVGAAAASPLTLSPSSTSGQIMLGYVGW
jgi:outer membrane scaffolding protein for murein synthesis (MipA/OmpV family)